MLNEDNMDLEDIPEQFNRESAFKRNLTCSQWTAHMNNTFGAGIVTLLCFAYFNIGFRAMYILAVKDLFKLYLNLEPAEAQFFSSVIALPMALKVVYGLLVDNVKLCGSSRKNYLKLCGFIMVVSLILIQSSFMQNKYLVLMMLVIYGMSTAVADVVCDAIMVTASRRDPAHGSSDLQTLHIVSICIGGIFGSSIASVATKYLHPYSIFCIYIGMGLIYTGFAFCTEEIVTSEHVSVRDNLKTSCKHLSHSIVYKSMLFLFVSRAIVPSYGDILYYWMIDYLNFTKTIIALLALIAFTTAIIGSMVYNLFLKSFEFRSTMIIAHLLISFSILGTFCLVTRISYEVFHINDLLFAIFGDALLETLFVAFIYMPTLVFQTKIVPKNIEATVYSFFTSLMLLANQFVSPMLGGAIAKAFGVTRTNFDSLGAIVMIQFFLALSPLLLIWLLPSNYEIQEFYDQMQMPSADEVELKNKQGHKYSSDTNKFLKESFSRAEHQKFKKYF